MSVSLFKSLSCDFKLDATMFCSIIWTRISYYWSYSSPNSNTEPKIKTAHPVGDSCFRVSISVNCTACPPPLVLKTSPWDQKAVNKAQSLGQYDGYSDSSHTKTEVLTNVISARVSSQQAYVHKYSLPHYVSSLTIHRTIKSEHHRP